MKKNKTYSAAPKERFVGVRFDQATYNKTVATARAADLSVSEYIRRMVIKGKVLFHQEIIAEVPMLKQYLHEKQVDAAAEVRAMQAMYREG